MFSAFFSFNSLTNLVIKFWAISVDKQLSIAVSLVTYSSTSYFLCYLIPKNLPSNYFLDGHSRHFKKKYLSKDELLESTGTKH